LKRGIRHPMEGMSSGLCERYSDHLRPRYWPPKGRYPCHTRKVSPNTVTTAIRGVSHQRFRAHQVFIVRCGHPGSFQFGPPLVSWGRRERDRSRPSRRGGRHGRRPLRPRVDCLSIVAAAHINALWACQVRWQAEDLRPRSPAKRARAAGSTCEPEARRTDFASQDRRMHVRVGFDASATV